MIVGAHSVIYSKDAERDRAFLRDVFDLPSVDAGGGWLIFGLPPAEVAVHPAEASGAHELYLMTNDIEAFLAELRSKGVPCTSPKPLSWGVLTEVTLPGGGRLGVYQPRHARPKPPRARKSAPARPRAKKRATKAKPGTRAAMKRRPARRSKRTR